jgi:hypothetical protein
MITTFSNAKNKMERMSNLLGNIAEGTVVEEEEKKSSAA